MQPIRDVAGYCPMGCGTTLHLMPGGMIQCLASDCPDPGAVTKILAEAETRDIVQVEGGHFNVLHPLRERIGGALLSCPVAASVAGLSRRALPDGRYRVHADVGTLRMEPLSSPLEGS
jgi:hypothetical protein